jgi:hypothetical protein
VDIGSGDVVTPAAREIDFPTVLEFPAPRLRAYCSRPSSLFFLQGILALLWQIFSGGRVFGIPKRWFA